MICRKCFERTMSVKLPPQVEFNRLGKRKALSFTSSSRGPAMTPQTCTFLPNAIRSGFTPKCSRTPHLAGGAKTGLHFVENQEHLVLVADFAQLLQPFFAKMIIAAFALNRLDDDRRDIDRRVRARNCMISASDFFSRSITSASRSSSPTRSRCDGLETRGQLNFANKIRLARIGIRQAHGVAAAPVKGVTEMQDLRPAFAASCRHVLAHLPVHRGLERVLDRKRAAFDEEIAVERRQAGDAREGLDKFGVVLRVDIGVRDLDLRGARTIPRCTSGSSKCG